MCVVCFCHHAIFHIYAVNFAHEPNSQDEIEVKEGDIIGIIEENVKGHSNMCKVTNNCKGHNSIIHLTIATRKMPDKLQKLRLQNHRHFLVREMGVTLEVG